MLWEVCDVVINLLILFGGVALILLLVFSTVLTIMTLLDMLTSKHQEETEKEYAQRNRKRSARSTRSSGERVGRSRSISRKSGSRVREGFE